MEPLLLACIEHRDHPPPPGAAARPRSSQAVPGHAEKGTPQIHTNEEDPPIKPLPQARTALASTDRRRKHETGSGNHHAPPPYSFPRRSELRL